MKHFLSTNPLLIGIAALIAVVYAGGRAMLGRHEGVVAKGHAVQTAGLVRSARDAASSARVRGEDGTELAPLDREEPTGETGIWVHGHLSCDGIGYAGSLSFRVPSASAASGLGTEGGLGTEEGVARVTRTKDDGFFELVLDAGSAYEVRFAPEQTADGSTGAPAAVLFAVELPDASEHALELALPTGRIEGRILTPDDQPVGDALLSLYSGPSEDDTPAGTPIAKSGTDEEGRFAFALLESGTYRVFARSRNGRQFARETLVLADGDDPAALTLRWAY